MANQMIALQARAPQASGLGSAIQQNAQMINMLAQQRASQRQAEQAQQKMAIEAELAGPQLAEAKSKAFSAEQKALTDFFDVAAKVIGISKTPEDVLFGADMLKKQYASPLFAQMIDQTIKDMPTDPQAFGAWRNQTKLETLDAKDQVPYLFEQVRSKELIGEGGDVGVLTTGGLGAPTIKTPRTLVPAPERRGTVSVAPATAPETGVGGPETDALADVAAGVVSAQNDREYQDALALVERANPDMGAALRRTMPRFDPTRIEGIRAEFSRAFGRTPNMPLVGGERGGVGGPDEGYIEAPTPFRAKNPMQAPMPGSAIVPLPRLAAEKTVETRAQKTAELEAERAKAAPAKQRVSTIIGKMKGAYEALDKAEAIPSEKRGGFANAMDYLATSALGREAQRLIGTEQSKNLTQITNLRKQLATAIKNATGMSAQEMNSNVELQLMLDTLSDPTQGIEAARQTLSDLDELYGAPKPAARPAPAQRRTPTKRTNIDALLKKYGD